jgi:hypothetical protein
MKSLELLQVQAYLDNELSPADARKVAALISTNPEAQALYRELKDTRELVMANEPQYKLQEPKDFYWAQIQRQIESSEKSAERAPRNNWFVRWVAPLAGACALIALGISILHVGNNKPVDIVSDNYPIGPTMPPVGHQATPATLRQIEGAEMSTITFRSESEGMTVVWISNDI